MENINPTKRAARIAGLLYVLMSIPALFSIIYVPRVLIVPGNATATASNILASETLFRLSIVCELIHVTAFIFLVRALYRLLNGIKKAHASMMVTLALVSVPITFLNVVNEIAALTLMRGADFLSVFEKGQLDAMAMLFLILHGKGFVVAQIFFGLWLFPFGLLVMESGFIPRILGVLLIVAGFGYVAASLLSLLLPGGGNVILGIPKLLTAGEFPIILWLLIKGVNVKSLAAPAP